MKITVKLEFDREVPDEHFDDVDDLRDYVDAAPEWIHDNLYVDGHDRIQITEVRV